MPFFSKPKLFGLMITRHDMPIFDRWMQRHASLFDAISVVDGSDDDQTKAVCDAYENVLYRRDPEPPITDQSLRAAGWENFAPLTNTGDWVMICHPDEFFIHDPREFLGVHKSLINWTALHILPHPSERDAWERGDHGGDITKLFKHYWWKENGTATIENRMFRIGAPPQWDLEDERPSSFVIPKNYIGTSEYRKRPAYLHYKVQRLDPEEFENGMYRDSSLNTGLNISDISRVEDLFFDENNPWGHKGFTQFSSDPSLSGFDAFKGKYRL